MKNILLALVLISATMLSSCHAISIDSPDPDYRRRAVDKMDKSTAASTGKLMELLKNDSDDMVRSQCAYYLGYYQRKEAVPALLAIIEARLAQIDSLTDDNLLTRQEAVWALGELKDISAVPVLVKLLPRDRNTEVRQRCAVALGKINDPKAVDGLIQQLDDVSGSVSNAALQSLKKITGKDLGKDIKQWEKWRESQK